MPLPLKSLSLILTTLLLCLASPVYLKGTSARILEAPAQAQTPQDRKAEADRFLQLEIQQQNTGQLETAIQSFQTDRFLQLGIQQQNTGQLETAIQSFQADRFLQLGIQQQNTGQLETAIQSFQQALTIYKELQAQASEAATLALLGETYNSLADYQQAIDFTKQALAIERELKNPQLEAFALITLGSAYNSLATSPTEYQKAIEFLQQGLTVARNIKNPQLEAQALLTLGSAYNSLANSPQEYQKAIEFLQQGLTVAREIKNSPFEAVSLITLGGAYNSLATSPTEYQKAIEFLQQGLTVAREIKNPQLEAQALLTLGSAYNSLATSPQEYQKAIEFAQQGLTIARELKNLQFEVVALDTLVSAYLNLEDFQQALNFAQQRLIVARQVNNREFEAKALIYLGDIYDTISDYQKTVDMSQQGLTIARELKNRPLEAEALIVLGSAYDSLGDYDQALELTQQGLEIARQVQNRELEAKALNTISDSYYSLHEYQKSLEYAQASLAIAREIKNPASEIQTLLNLAIIYFDLGDYEEFNNLATQSLTIGRQIKQSPVWEATSLFFLAANSFVQGDYKKTVEFSEQVLATLPEFKSPEMASTFKAPTLMFLSMGYGGLGNSEKAVELAQQGLSSAREQEDGELEGYALNILGSIYSKYGRTQQAIAVYQESLALGSEAVVNAGLGRIYKNLNMPVTAITYYKQAINDIEEVRQKNRGLSAKLQKSLLQSVQFDVNRTTPGDIYRELADLLLSQGRILEAQQVLELLKVQELRDFTKNTRAGGKNPEVTLNQTEEQIKQENGTLIAFGQRLYECQQTRCNQLSQLLDQREVLTEQFNQKVQVIEKQVRDRKSQDDAFLDPKKLGLKAKEIVEAQPGTVLIYPLVLNDKIWLLWASKGGIVKTVEVPKVGQKQLAETVLKFRQLLQTPNSNIAELQATGKQLYDWLIKPIEPELKANKIQNLVFSLDRAARYIPMSALFDGEKYLIENYAVSTVLSADLTNTSDRIPPGTQNTSVLALGLSNAVSGFNALPNVPAELDAIVRKKSNDTQGIYPGLEFLNKDFDWRSLRDNLLGHKLLHIATHGEFVPGSPDASYLLLGTGEKLAIPKITTLQDLGNVSLVVLSACQTALGEPGQDGNEINGISYYFLNAGAKAVMASLWKVDDDSTSQLMQNFYGNLAKGTANAPITKAEALRHAQLNLLRGNSSTTDNFEQRSSLGAIPRIDSQTASTNSTTLGFSHPYYWAPFILIGNSL